MIIEDRTRSMDGFATPNDWESRNSKKGILRPRFMSASDYVFYLRRHLVAERRKNDPTVGHPGDENLSMGIPRLSFLLRRLEEDIQSSYLSFLEEFVSDIHEGISCLLNILRTCQERQKGAGLFTYATCSRAKQNLINRGTIDEFYCLLCLKACTKSSAAVSKISEHKTGLTTIASCITSSHMKSRIVALELLTIVCRNPECGNTRVLEAMTTIRILFGESVRFKFLVSVLNSNLSTASGLETVALIFINTLLDQCPKLSDRVRIQSEIEEAGFDIDYLEKQLRLKFGSSTHRIWSEIDKWRELYIDLQDALHKHQENLKLRKEVELLKDALKRLRDERRGILTLHKQLKGQWNHMEQRLEDLALKSRVLTSTSSASSTSSEDVRPTTPVASQLRPTYPADPPTNDSELDEILIDIPTISPGSILDRDQGNSRISDHLKLSDSGISSHSAEPDSDPEWRYPDIRTPDRHINGRVRFVDATCRRSLSSGGISDIPPGAIVLPPGQNKTKCADIVGVQNIPPPPLPPRPEPVKSKTAKKKRSLSASRSLLPRSLQNNRNSKSTSNLATLKPVNNNKYCGGNKLWNKNLMNTSSQMGSSLDGMIHREIAKAIRDRHALFQTH